MTTAIEIIGIEILIELEEIKVWILIKLFVEIK